MVDSLEKQSIGAPINLENMDITFEYIVGSLFPDALTKIKEMCTKQYIQGYEDSINFGEPQDKTHFKFAVTELDRAISTLETIQRLDEVSDEDAAYAYELAHTLKLLKEPME